MSYETCRLTLSNHVDTNYDDTTYGPMFYENLPFAAPSGSYAFFTILDGPASQVSLSGGQNLFRYFGSLQLDYLVPEDQGTRKARQFADHCISFLLNASFRLSDQAFVQLRVPELRPLGLTEGRYRFVLSTEFYRDEYLTNSAFEVVQY